MDITSSENWYRIAIWFASMSIDEAINRTLGLLSKQACADRAWVIRYSEDGLHFWNTHEWAAAGVDRFVDDLQGVPTKSIHWLQKQLETGKIVQVFDVDKMTKKAGTFRTELKRQRVKSIVCIPIFIHEKLVLQVGCETVHEHTQWGAHEIDLMQQAGVLFAKSLAREQTQAVKPTGRPINTVPLRRGLGIVNIEAQQIAYIQAERDYSRVYFERDQSLIQHATLKRWETILPKAIFIRIHKSLIVNMEHIQSLDRTGGQWSVKLNHLDEALPVGRAYRKALRDQLHF